MKLICDTCQTRYVIGDHLVRGKVVRFRCKKCASILKAHLPATSQAPDQLYCADDEAPRPPPLPQREWFLAVQGREVGPLTFTEVRQRIQRGEATAEDFLWHKGMEGWQPIAMVSELTDALLALPKPAQTTPPPLPASLPPAAPGQSHPYAISASFAPLAAHLPPRLSPGSSASYPYVFASPPGSAGNMILQGATPHPYAPYAEGPIRLPDGSALWPLYAPPRPAAHWPFWLAIFGGVAMVIIAVALLFFYVRPRQRAFDESEMLPLAAPRTPMSSPAMDLPEEGLDDEPPRRRRRAAHHDDYPPIEIRRARKEGPGRRAQEDVVERIPSLPPTVAEKLKTQPGDEKTALALQIYRQNRRSLLACDQLAERRGETFPVGSFAEFEVSTLSGKERIVVRSASISAQLLSCYRAMASQWKLPNMGTSYSTSFKHLQ